MHLRTALDVARSGTGRLFDTERHGCGSLVTRWALEAHL
jgi:hypothetical protein